MDCIPIAILIVLLKEVDGNEEAPQCFVIEASVHLGLADIENNLIIGVQWDVICSMGLESVGIRRAH